MDAPDTLPQIDGPAGLRVFAALLRRRSVLGALEQLHAELGDVFRIPLPVFNPFVLVGPEANRFVAVTGRHDLRWRPEGDPVAKLLRQGVLVTDGELHDELRGAMTPALHKRQLAGYAAAMLHRTDQVIAAWGASAEVDMLVEMRRAALLILMDTLYRVDFTAELQTLWDAILKTLKYISPGPWVVFPGIPRLGYRRHLERLDRYLYAIIAHRRRTGGPDDDLLGGLIAAGMGDDLIRDQLLTMLIAGHDTSTALLAWALYLLGAHPPVLQRVQAEVDAELGAAPPDIDNTARLEYLERVLDETLRLYPPIHIGNRRAAVDLEFNGHAIPAGSRVVYSIYLSHRHPDFWDDPDRFDPDRFIPERAYARPHYVYLPFGGGPRNCIGLAFAQVEAKIVLARILQRYEVRLTEPQVHMHMGATLEPRPGVRMRVTRRPDIT